MYLERTQFIFNIRCDTADNITDDSDVSLGEDDVRVCFSLLRYYHIGAVDMCLPLKFRPMNDDPPVSPNLAKH